MKNTFAAILALVVLFTASSCGKKTPPLPSNTKMRMELVLDIFDSLKRSDHKAVIAKIERLRAIDSTNVFLSEFEGIERANLMLHEAELALMRNDRKYAEEAIREAVRQVGNVSNLLKASEDIRDIAELERLAELIAKPLNSAALQEDISEFRALAKKVGAGERVLAFADLHERQIPALKFREHKITLYSLEADRLFFRKNETKVLDSLDSLKKIEQNSFR